MIKQPIQLFKLMYLALIKEWEKEKEKQLGLFLSDADPFITGGDSADPAVFEDFAKAFQDYGSFDDYGYDFILRYLSGVDPFYGDVKKYFARIDKQQYIVESAKYSSMSDETIIDLFGLYIKEN